ncbi:hypothetical protein HMPREF9477_00001 [Lachnospiraceae bacterium 2_1_46FAA]|nr:hypothetical protein HMPREF9477_00001 [Lachnospiraceae bacterium 2_1_46FAA]
MAKEKGSFKEFLSAVAPEYQTSLCGLCRGYCA